MLVCDEIQKIEQKLNRSMGILNENYLKKYITKKEYLEKLNELFLFNKELKYLKQNKNFELLYEKYKEINLYKKFYYLSIYNGRLYVNIVEGCCLLYEDIIRIKKDVLKWYDTNIS